MRRNNTIEISAARKTGVPGAEQVATVERLRMDVERAYDRAVARVAEATADGTLLRGEVLARWQEFVGTGELLRCLEAKVGRFRDRMVNAIKGKPQQAERVTVAVESGPRDPDPRARRGRRRAGRGLVAEHRARPARC